MMRRKLFNLWTPASHTITTCGIGDTTSDSKFMENYSSDEDYDVHYDDHDDFVLVRKWTLGGVADIDSITEHLQVVAPALVSAVEAEEGQEGDTTSATLVPSVSMVDLISETTVPRPMQELPEFNIEIFIVGAAVFIVCKCCAALKSWIQRCLSQVGRLGIRWYGTLRTLIVKICAWAARE